MIDLGTQTNIEEQNVVLQLTGICSSCLSLKQILAPYIFEVLNLIVFLLSVPQIGWMWPMISSASVTLT